MEERMTMKEADVMCNDIMITHLNLKETFKNTPDLDLLRLAIMAGVASAYNKGYENGVIAGNYTAKVG